VVLREAAQEISGVAAILEQMTDTLRPHCYGLSQEELKLLANRLFETSARFVLSWVEEGGG
jgi:hypothetical protein